MRGGYEVVLSDGSFLFVSTAVWTANRLHEGQIVEDRLIERIARLSAVADARERAVALLARREHSRAELVAKLVKRRFAGDVVSEALNGLTQEGLVDDDRFAGQWVRSRLARHPEGVVGLLAGLLKRGVSRETAEGCLSELLAEEETLLDDAIRAAAERIERSAALDTTALFRKLHARGFSSSRIREFLRERTSKGKMC